MLVSSGIYTPATGARAEEGLGHRSEAKRRAEAPVAYGRWELRPHDRSRCAEHGGSCQGSCNCAFRSVVPAPPGVVMVAPTGIPRNAEGAQCEGRVVW